MPKCIWAQTKERKRIESLLFPYGVTLSDFQDGNPFTFYYSLMEQNITLQFGSSIVIISYVKAAIFNYGSFSEEDVAFLFSAIYEACLEKTVGKEG